VTVVQALFYFLRHRHHGFEPGEPVVAPMPSKLRLRPVTHRVGMQPVVGYVTSRFGVPRGNHMHAGIDIGAPIGSPVRATADGRVQVVGVQHGYGLVVILDHGAGRQSLYAHLHDANVRVGQNVQAGDPIAHVGLTGHTTGPHLHYEERQAGQPINPTVG